MNQGHSTGYLGESAAWTAEGENDRRRPEFVPAPTAAAAKRGHRRRDRRGTPDAGVRRPGHIPEPPGFVTAGVVVPLRETGRITAPLNGRLGRPVLRQPLVR